MTSGIHQAEHSTEITESASPREACDRFLDRIRTWAHRCIEEYDEQPPTDGHDQLTYVTGWEPYLLTSHDEHVFRFLESAQEEVAAHFANSDAWRHGYWRMQEAHHGTEHFELFLGFMTRVSPDNRTTTAQLVDAVEHIGNWCPDVPDWFDYSTGLFRSLHFGADGVRDDEDQLNMPDHLRCANLLMLTHNATRDTKYFDLARSYSETWASAICSEDRPLPIGITRDGAVYELSDPGEETYRSFAGMAGDLETDLDRAENILASSGIQLLLQVWQETREDLFLRAVTRLLHALADELGDADAGPVADAIRLYRRVTGRRDFDRQITQLVEDLAPHDTRTIGIALPQNLDRRPAGVGKRTDMPAWYQDDSPRRHDPVLLSVAAEVLDDRDLAIRALDEARAYFEIATSLLPDGRHHGCAARTVSAIARGHGRSNHAGMTTAVLLPTMQHLNLL